MGRVTVASFGTWDTKGDFALLNADSTPDGNTADWFYAQHGPSFVSSNTTGKFSMTLFDNGNDRVFPTGVTCGTAGAPPCFYSTVPVLQIDAAARTATIVSNMVAPSYSFFGGNSAQLKNGNLEFCESAGGPGVSADIYEVTQGNAPQTVWQMAISGSYSYRGQRIPSLYPGVQW